MCKHLSSSVALLMPCGRHVLTLGSPSLFHVPWCCRRNSRGVRIVANSYGCSTANVNACYSRQFEKAIAAFKAQGGLFIASAGNSGTNNDKVGRCLAHTLLLPDSQLPNLQAIELPRVVGSSCTLSYQAACCCMCCCVKQLAPSGVLPCRWRTTLQTTKLRMC